MAEVQEIVHRIAEHWSHGSPLSDGYWLPPKDAEAIEDWLVVLQAKLSNQKSKTEINGGS